MLCLKFYVFFLFAFIIQISKIKKLCILNSNVKGGGRKWPDKSTTSYDMLDFKSCIENLTRKYLVTERHMLKLQGILLQYLKFN